MGCATMPIDAPRLLYAINHIRCPYHVVPTLLCCRLILFFNSTLLAQTAVAKLIKKAKKKLGSPLLWEAQLQQMLDQAFCSTEVRTLPSSSMYVAHAHLYEYHSSIFCLDRSSNSPAIA